MIKNGISIKTILIFPALKAKAIIKMIDIAFSIFPITTKRINLKTGNKLT